MNYRQRSRKTTEFLLAVDCCRWNFADVSGAPIEKPAGNVDWERFLRLSRRHRVQGLVWNCLSRQALAIPQVIEQSLAADAAAIARTNLRAARQSALLLEAFAGAGIPLIFVKGLSLSKLAYGDPFVKMSQDIDVLVPADAVCASATELQRRDYRLEHPAAHAQSGSFERWHRRRKESVWRSPEGLNLELHSRLADSFELIPDIDVRSPRQDVEIAPGIVLPTLADDELFTYLCVHGASSAWFRLKWISDLAALLHDRSAEQIERLYDRSQQLRAGRSAAQALLLANRTYGTAEGSDIVRRLRLESRNRWLAATAWNQMLNEAEPTATRFGTGAIHLTQLLLLPGAGFKLRELVRQLADAKG